MDGLDTCNTATDRVEPEVLNTMDNETQGRSTTPNRTNRHQQRPRTSLYNASSRTVRSNWITFLRISWQRISRTNKVIIMTTSFISMAEIIITIVMLILGRSGQCNKPLDIYLIVFVVRLGLSMPLTLYQHLWPTGYNTHSAGNTISTRQSSILTSTAEVMSTTSQSIETTAAIINGHSNSITLSSVSSSSQIDQTTSEATTTPVPTTTETVAQTNNTIEESQGHNQPTLNTRSWIDRIKSFLDLISILWFIVGNYFIFTTSAQCHQDAKYLFYTTLTWILLGYFLILIPLLLCTVVVFCLPCLIVAMRSMNVDYATGMIGANKNEIQSIPIYKYRSLTSNERQLQDTRYVPTPSPTTISSTSSNTSQQSSKKGKRGIISYLISHRNKSHGSDGDEESAFEEWRMDPDDSSCTICLSDYEDGELICRLRCNHHFHKDCVHEWLALNYKCPLCQRDFRSTPDEPTTTGRTDLE